MAGERVPFWTRLSEVGFDVPVVLILADPTLAKLQSLWLVARHGFPTVSQCNEELFSKGKTGKICYVVDMSLSMKCMMLVQHHGDFPQLELSQRRRSHMDVMVKQFLFLEADRI